MDAGMIFPRPIADRYFEDYVEGEVHRFGTNIVEADEIITVATRFDPQAMHTDPEARSIDCTLTCGTWPSPV